MDIFFSARIFGAEDAVRMGFVSRTAPAESFDQMVDEWCANVAENAPLTLRALKKTVNQLIRDPGDRDMAAAEAAIAACMVSEDYREGTRAFMEKRKPEFKGA
jgi:enoyl-CoA hydratase/carnithine racemase